jgi:hypothetical protein
MKIAWLVWEYEDTLEPDFTTEEPPVYYYKRVKIVYIEVIE